MLEIRDVSKEFQFRRKETWRATRLWLAMLLCSFLCLYLLGEVDTQTDPGKLLKFIGFMSISILAIARIVHVVRSTYLCPACEEMPMSRAFGAGSGCLRYEDGVNLAPKNCSHCGAKLA